MSRDEKITGIRPTLTLEDTDQKPIELLEQLIKDSTNEGDTILDCFMGSGSTMEACVNTGRKGIGIELSQDYYNISKNRIESHTIRSELF